MKDAHALGNDSAGARTIAKMVSAERLPLSRYRAGRRMRTLGLVSSQQPKHRYKNAEQPHIGIPNRLDRQLDVAAPNKAWVGDITYGLDGMVLDVSKVAGFSLRAGVAAMAHERRKAGTVVSLHQPASDLITVEIALSPDCR